MDDLDFYNVIANPINRLTYDAVQALMVLFHRCDAIDEACAAILADKQEAKNG